MSSPPPLDHGTNNPHPTHTSLQQYLWKPLQDPSGEYPLISHLSTQHPTQPIEPSTYIPIFTPDELQTLSPSSCPTIPTTHIYPLPPTRNAYLPILWPAANRWRLKNGLSYKSLQIQLPASIDTSCYKEWERTAGIPVAPWAGVEALDAMVMDCRMRQTSEEEWVRVLVSRWPGEERAWVRLGEWALGRGWWKGVQGAFRAALVRAKGEKRRRYYETLVLRAAGETEWGVWTDDEMQALRGFRGKVMEELVKGWWMDVPETAQRRSVDTRLAQYVPMKGWWKLPRFFSWVVPFHLAGMSTPKRKGDVDALKTLGITHVLTLTEEEPLHREWFGRVIRNTHIPVQNLFPPTVQQMDRALRMILEEPVRDPGVRGTTLVHCGGGKGRAGTVLAVYIALFGFTTPGSEGYYNPGHSTPPKMEGRKAVEFLRSMRPRSIETERQEKFVEKYVSLAWKRYGQGQPLYGNGGEVDEPVGLQLEITGDITEPDVIVLVGVQGSGKSTFCKMAKLRNPNVVIASPDDVVADSEGVTRSASASRACEGVIGRFKRSPANQNPRRALILDRCNPTPEERKYWTSLLTTPAKNIIVWFDYDPDHCRARVENRTSHPTLPPWRAKTAIDSVSKMLKAPRPDEGFSGIARIRGVDNARELANHLFGPVNMRKFIRTRHLLDLGGATRDDLIIPPQDLARHFLQHVIIEEKVDGANLGISLSATGEFQVQNRSHYVSANDHAQFSLLPAWLEEKAGPLKQILGSDEAVLERYVLYGEWMVAVHSIEYTHLPDWFIAFDLYDRVDNRFLTRRELDSRLKDAGISQVPVIYEGLLENEDVLRRLLDTKSCFSPEVKVEGVVVRFSGDERGKVVRGDFLAGSRHWSKNELRRNRVWRS
ncbi:hypothetical protein BDD12DRAFT_855549 [Trichophaea hybrida]|nr:hypothetical protein BDD12DRAFT_855549 [Trichophaea hybrida]